MALRIGSRAGESPLTATCAAGYNSVASHSARNTAAREDVVSRLPSARPAPGSTSPGSAPCDWYRALVSGQRRDWRAALQRGGLRLASWPYGWGVALRNVLYARGWKSSQRLPVPVVSVGNLTVGGTGKTPCVEYVARYYREQERCVAILSRGYGSTGGLNDEGLVLEENLPDVPHLQGADRVALGRAAVEELESEILVLDDGFQHRRLARDLDVVLVDATNPWGYGHLLPRGLLRESPRQLRRASLVLLTRCDQAEAEELGRLRATVARLAPQAPVVETMHGPVALVNGMASAALQRLREQPVAAFCGLANPEAFRHTLLDLGAEVCAFRAFPDHHAYARADVESLAVWVREQARDCLVVTTQKDLVKLRLARLGERELWAVRISLVVTRGQDELHGKLEEVLSFEP
jgi:tetraacyldisaccharide 4'-kinase